MTNRERILAVILGHELDRVPFVQYNHLGAPNEEVWSELGRDCMGVLRWTSLHRFVHPNCRFVTEEVPSDGPRLSRRTLYTPKGALTEMRRFEPTYGTANLYEHFVKEPGDFRALISYFRDITVIEDLTQFENNRRELGDDGLSLVNTGRTPYQQLWVQWVSLTDLVLYLADYPDLLDECTREMERIQTQVFEIVARSPAQLVDIGDNITAPAIGRSYFERYCAPAYRELAELLADRPQPVPVFVHMDGDLRPLHDQIGRSGVGGIDSFSPQPDNDNSPAEALALWPHMRLLVNFPSSVHLKSAQTIYETAMRILEEAGHSGQLQIQISENVPPGVWRKSYPAIVRAIADFGKPGGRA